MSEPARKLVNVPRQVSAKLAVRNLTKDRTTAAGGKIVAVDDVSFEVANGEFVCLLGPSGCGKTSILNILAGLEFPTTGQALVDGRPITGPGPDRAVLFQEPALFPWLSVAANIELALELEEVSAADRRERAMHWLSNVHLDRFANAHPHE